MTSVSASERAIAPERLVEQNVLRVELGLPILPDPDTMLDCSVCGQWKPDEEFWRHKMKRTRRGRRAECRSCMAVKKTEWAWKNSRPCQDCGVQWVRADAKQGVCRPCGRKRGTEASRRGWYAHPPATCKSCGVQLSKRVTRLCRPCYESGWRETVEPICVDCGRTVSASIHQRCRACENGRRLAA